MPGTPLPTDGVIGKLKPDQEAALKSFWKEFLNLVDESPEEGSGAHSAAMESAGDKPGKDIPKDDAAKEKLKAEQEMRDAKLAFVEYGSKRFMDAYWRFIAMDDPDGIMLRFLRARKWSPSAGVAMLAACIKWRMGSDVEKIFEKGEEGMQNADGFIRQMEIGKTYTQGTDYYGRPVTYIHVAKHRTYDQSAKALEDFVLFQMESIRCLFAPPVDKVVIVFDMTGFGIRNVHWRCILFIVKCLESYYPESLHCMLVHNAPWVFQGIWKVLAPMLDPVVRNKIQMTKSTEDLCQHIPKAHLVKELGGSSEWRWKYPPIVPGENAPQQDGAGRKKHQKAREALISEYVGLTREWIASDDENVAKRRELCVDRMRAQYHELDPFIRGRGAYHRNGNGLVVWNYPSASEEKSEGEWEVRGYETCREECLLRAKQIGEELRATAAA
ncbi:CRAL-TRIO domain-containing protein [Rhodotorula paludigena]|uniref:CRAL-TRIO domain-containing protein n=1 Tax=Rhodotorula paludigena TaxID=86838 RepID=UPI003171B60A